MHIRPTHAVVDLGALQHNIRELRSRLPQTTKFMAVVKADAYGHGIVEISRAAVAAGVEYLGVAILEEGIALREAGVGAPILILGGILPEFAEDVVRYDLRATVFSLPVMHALLEAARRQGKRAVAHIKADTGMNRIGTKGLEELRGLLDEAARNQEHLSLEGMFTHFAVSELQDKSFTLQQITRFGEAVALARGMGFSPLLHAANSGGILDLPLEAGFDLVRGGIAMYGYAPGEGCGRWAQLRPVLTWKTAIVHIKEIQPEDTVSYGREYTAREMRRVATLPVGYGDGYHRRMSGQAQVLLYGKRAPVLGTICMDQIMVDISDIPEARVGDDVILLGESGGERIGAGELAGWAGTISYEALLSISPRVPRVYVRG